MAGQTGDAERTHDLVCTAENGPAGYADLHRWAYAQRSRSVRLSEQPTELDRAEMCRLHWRDSMERAKTRLHQTGADLHRRSYLEPAQEHLRLPSEQAALDGPELRCVYRRHAMECAEAGLHQADSDL